MQSLKGMIYTERFLLEPGELLIEKDIIQEIRLCERDCLTDREKRRYLLPGLIDIP